ncbi:hypothetical protein HZA55_06790, partial [Candidatus Poribacteria bacterium]|nr:hypothetical protein [Candidatus Poribacteria bacterium]
LQSYGENPQIDLIFGMPGQSLKSFNNDILLLEEHNICNILFSPLMIFPGTKLSNELETKEIIKMKTPQNFGYNSTMGLGGYEKALLIIEIHNLLNIFHRGLSYVDLGLSDFEKVNKNKKYLLNIIKYQSQILELCEMLQSSAMYIKKHFESLIKKSENFIGVYFDKVLKNVEYINELLKLDILEQAMNLRSKELLMDINSKKSYQKIFFREDIQKQQWKLNNEIWLESFRIPHEIIYKESDVFSNSTENNVFCIFFCPSAEIHFVDEREFILLKNFDYNNESAFLEKWIKLGWVEYIYI